MTQAERAFWMCVFTTLAAILLLILGFAAGNFIVAFVAIPLLIVGWRYNREYESLIRIESEMNANSKTGKSREGDRETIKIAIKHHSNNVEGEEEIYNRVVNVVREIGVHSPFLFLVKSGEVSNSFTLDYRNKSEKDFVFRVIVPYLIKSVEPDCCILVIPENGGVFVCMVLPYETTITVVKRDENVESEDIEWIIDEAHDAMLEVWGDRV